MIAGVRGITWSRSVSTWIELAALDMISSTSQIWNGLISRVSPARSCGCDLPFRSRPAPRTQVSALRKGYEQQEHSGRFSADDDRRDPIHFPSHRSCRVLRGLSLPWGVEPPLTNSLCRRQRPGQPEQGDLQEGTTLLDNDLPTPTIENPDRSADRQNGHGSRHHGCSSDREN